MGNKDFIKAILERQGIVHFGRVRLRPHPLHLLWHLEQELKQLHDSGDVAQDLPFLILLLHPHSSAMWEC